MGASLLPTLRLRDRIGRSFVKSLEWLGLASPYPQWGLPTVIIVSVRIAVAWHAGTPGQTCQSHSLCHSTRLAGWISTIANTVLSDYGSVVSERAGHQRAL